jgi:hypothetical protein
VTAFEYYLDKGVDEILKIKGKQPVVFEFPNLQVTGEEWGNYATVTDAQTWSKFKDMLNALEQHKNVVMYIPLSAHDTQLCCTNFIFDTFGFYCETKVGDFDNVGYMAGICVALGVDKKTYEIQLIYTET